MINNAKVIPDSSMSKILFFHEAEIKALPNRQIVPLFGANGSGKTTFLNSLDTSLSLIQKQKEYNKKEKEAKDKDDEEELSVLKMMRKNAEQKNALILDVDNVPTAWYSYQNSRDNFRNRQARSMFEDFNPIYIRRRMDAQALSEGQSIMYSVLDLLNGMLPSTKTRESFIEDESRHCIVLLDELDSGLSLDNLDKCLRIMKRAVRIRDNVQFIFSFNTSYVLKYFPDVLSMYDGKVLHLTSEEEMMQELNNNKKMLKKARQKSNGEYRIF